MIDSLLGRHSCLFCHITKEQMQLAPVDRPKISNRSLESLKSDLEKFREDGANIKRAKFYNNVIDDPMFNVPLDQVNSHLPLTVKSYMGHSSNLCRLSLKIHFLHSW